jgi:hypothetical protein
VNANLITLEENTLGLSENRVFKAVMYCSAQLYVKDVLDNISSKVSVIFHMWKRARHLQYLSCAIRLIFKKVLIVNLVIMRFLHAYVFSYPSYYYVTTCFYVLVICVSESYGPQQNC